MFWYLFWLGVLVFTGGIVFISCHPNKTAAQFTAEERDKIDEMNRQLRNSVKLMNKIVD